MEVEKFADSNWQLLYYYLLIVQETPAIRDLPIFTVAPSVTRFYYFIHNELFNCVNSFLENLAVKNTVISSNFLVCKFLERHTVPFHKISTPRNQVKPWHFWQCLRIQSQYRKIQARKNSVFGHFPCSVHFSRFYDICGNFSYSKKQKLPEKLS